MKVLLFVSFYVLVGCLVTIITKNKIKKMKRKKEELEKFFDIKLADLKDPTDNFNPISNIILWPVHVACNLIAFVLTRNI